MNQWNVDFVIVETYILSAFTFGNVYPKNTLCNVCTFNSENNPLGIYPCIVIVSGQFYKDGHYF